MVVTEFSPMAAAPGPLPDLPTVLAAQHGDKQALADVASGCLPLLYNIVGRALNGHPDVDDVVQETVLRVVRGIPKLRQPTAFRSWLVAVAIRQIRDHQNSRRPHTNLDSVAEVADPRADFVEMTILSLGLSDQRKEIAEATRWLDADDRELLALWWLKEGGRLTRSDLVAALDVPSRHVAVRVQRMKRQLDIGRAVVRILARPGECAELTKLLTPWDGTPATLWRKRFSRHIRDCNTCTAHSSDLIPAERLLAGLPLVPAPLLLAHAALPSVPAAATGLWRTRHTLKLLHTPTKGLFVIPLAAGAIAGAVGIASMNTSGEGHPAADTTPTAQPTPTAKVGAVQEPTRDRPPAVKKKAIAVAPKPAPCLKGVATWKFPAATKSLKASGACWYYDWSAGEAGITKPPGVEYVPMIWGTRSVTPATLARAKSRGRTLLGFNEPDMQAQANMTPTQALALWPKLMATKMRLGSPAVAFDGAKPGAWLDQFMKGAKARHYRVDFIPIHWYGSDFNPTRATTQLRTYLKAVQARYHKPIWLTEYALIHFTPTPTYPTQQQQATFLKASTKMLATLKGLERYAWFALPATKTSPTGLFTETANPTPIGKTFQSLPKTH